MDRNKEIKPTGDRFILLNPMDVENSRYWDFEKQKWLRGIGQHPAQKKNWRVCTTENKCGLICCEGEAAITVTTLSNHTLHYCDKHSPELEHQYKIDTDKLLNTNIEEDPLYPQTAEDDLPF